MNSSREPITENIIFFDGICSLCNGFIDFLIRHDKTRRFHFAPLQGSTAQHRLPMSRIQTSASDGPAFSSVVYLRDGVMLTKSNAVLQIVSELGGMWALVTLLKVIPSPVRDQVYEIIATNRYRWFGKRDTCRVPTKEERLLFLD